MNSLCHCPYVVCPIHGDCEACIQKNLREHTLANCMEAQAERLGAKIPSSKLPAVILDDEEAVAQKCAAMIADIVARKPDAMLCLPAGNTAIRTYEILCGWVREGHVSWDRVRFVALDEWLDLEDESDNCEAFMNRHLYGPMGIRLSQRIRFDTHAPDLDAECRRVDQAIRDGGGIDLMMLGMGMNGHLALNEPGGSFGDRVKVVDLDSVTMQVGQKYFDGPVRLTRGITLGVRLMFEAGQVILQVTGRHKAEIMARVNQTPPTEQLPATVLKLLHGATVILDRDAASLFGADA